MRNDPPAATCSRPTCPSSGGRTFLWRAGIEIPKAVAAGKISKEQGRAKREAIRKKMGLQGERGAERGPSRPDWEGIKRRIEGAVKRGDMTREQAGAKYKEIRERMAGRRQR